MASPWINILRRPVITAFTFCPSITFRLLEIGVYEARSQSVQKYLFSKESLYSQSKENLSNQENPPRTTSIVMMALNCCMYSRCWGSLVCSSVQRVPRLWEGLCWEFPPSDERTWGWPRTAEVLLNSGRCPRRLITRKVAWKETIDLLDWLLSNFKGHLSSYVVCYNRGACGGDQGPPL